MKKAKKELMFAMFCMVCCFLQSVQVNAAQPLSEQNPDRQAQTTAESYVQDMADEIDFSELDSFLEKWQTPERLSFSELVRELLADGAGNFDYGRVLLWLKDAMFAQVEKNRKLLLEVMLLAVVFSVLKNFAGAFVSSYISDLCFILVYCVLAVLLLQSFVSFRSVVEGVLAQSVEFMKILIPAFCVAMVFSAGTAGAAGFYQTAFLVIYLIEWLFVNLLIPLIHIYVLLELVSHFFEEEKFSNLTELLKGLICGGMRLAGVFVLGLNAVQSVIAPAKDRLERGGIGRAVSMIPGIGNVTGGVGELLLDSGILIKNGIGAAALVILVLLALFPAAQAACMVFFYKAAAAVAEPVADSRVAGCLKGMAEGGMLYLKLMGYGIALFFVTIALCTASSGFIH